MIGDAQTPVRFSVDVTKADGRDTLQFAIEEYKSVREEQLLRIREMDTLLFRTIGVCAVLYSLAFVDVPALSASNTDFDGRFLRFLVFFPPVIIFFAGFDYRRRLDTLILCSRYLARLEAAIYAPNSAFHDWIFEKTERSDSGMFSRWLGPIITNNNGFKEPPPPEIRSVLGYDLFHIAANRFEKANFIRDGIWIAMFLLSLILIFVQKILII